MFCKKIALPQYSLLLSSDSHYLVVNVVMFTDYKICSKRYCTKIVSIEADISCDLHYIVFTECS